MDDALYGTARDDDGVERIVKLRLSVGGSRVRTPNTDFSDSTDFTDWSVEVEWRQEQVS